VTTPEETLALELIHTVKSKMSPRAVVLEDRIEGALEYLTTLSNPVGPAIKHVERYLLGDYDDLFPGSPAATVRDLFEKRWRCDVVASGFHNGAHCDPDDGHDDRCGYRWVAPALTEEQAREYGLIPNTTEEAACPKTSN